MILDDVFSALDRRTRWRIATDLLKQHTAKLERTIIYTTHDGRAIPFVFLKLERGDTEV